jgi:hypothetical protein
MGELLQQQQQQQQPICGKLTISLVNDREYEGRVACSVQGCTQLYSCAGWMSKHILEKHGLPLYFSKETDSADRRDDQGGVGGRKKAECEGGADGGGKAEGGSGRQSGKKEEDDGGGEEEKEGVGQNKEATTVILEQHLKSAGSVADLQIISG